MSVNVTVYGHRDDPVGLYRVRFGDGREITGVLPEEVLFLCKGAGYSVDVATVDERGQADPRVLHLLAPYKRSVTL